MIHSTAVIDPKAKLGKDVQVDPFAYIEQDVCIGDGAVIGPRVSILRHTTLGPGCRIHTGAVLGDLPQDMSFQTCESFVEIGANCVIREGVTIHRGAKAGTATTIGDDCFLMAFSHCAHNVKLGNGVVLANGVLLAGYVEIGDKAFLAGNAGVHQFVKVGRLVMMGAISVATKDVPPFCLLRDLALNTITGLNSVGLRRAGLSEDERAQIKQAYRILFRSGLNVTQALEKIRGAFDSGPALEFCAFAEESKRGLCGVSK